MAKLVGDEHYSIITDHLGTPNTVFDKDGNQVWSADISVWGELRNLQGDRDFCPFRYPGQYEDSETGLYYNRFRYYDPEAGRYVSQDPIGLEGGKVLYGYVDDSTTWIDPLGLSGCFSKIKASTNTLTKIVSGLADKLKVALARKRQHKMLKDNTGYNVSPTSWDQYPSIGRAGSFISDKKGVMRYFKPNETSGNVVITKKTAAKIERDMGLEVGSLANGFKVRKVENIVDRAPRSPMEGNQYFRGAGNHLPGGAPEMVVDSIPTKDSTGVTTILNVSVK